MLKLLAAAPRTLGEGAVRVDYGVLERVSTSLKSAASQVRGDAPLVRDLGSGARPPDGAYAAAVVDRETTKQRLAGLMEAQSTACAQMVLIFGLLDAQIAAQVSE